MSAFKCEEQNLSKRIESGVCVAATCIEYGVKKANGVRYKKTKSHFHYLLMEKVIAITKNGASVTSNSHKSGWEGGYFYGGV